MPGCLLLTASSALNVVESRTLLSLPSLSCTCELTIASACMCSYLSIAQSTGGDASQPVLPEDLPPMLSDIQFNVSARLTAHFGSIEATRCCLTTRAVVAVDTGGADAVTDYDRRCIC